MSLSLNISGIINPNISTSGSIVISTYTSANQLIDQISSGLAPQLQCNFPCRTCLTTNKDSCLSCFNGTSDVYKYL